MATAAAESAAASAVARGGSEDVDALACAVQGVEKLVVSKMMVEGSNRRIHAVDRSRVLCAHALGYAPQGGERFGLQAHASPAQAEVAFVHGTSRADKLWPEAQWIALGRRLIARGFAIGLPHGSDEERERAARIAQALGPQAQVWPRLSLGELADRLAACQGVIGVDSGLSHIATALDRPHVQIYNHDTAWRTGPVNRPRQASVFAQPHPALEAVLASWEQVTAA
jgi:heptosyltransferase-1